MTRLVMVRHAQSEGNLAGLFVGTGDPRLTSVGVTQAQRVAAAITRLGADIHRIVASPTLRTVHTAEAIARAMATPVDIEFDERLREMDYGDWEGVEFASVGDPRDVAMLFSDPDFAPPAGESVSDVCRRVAGALADLSADSDSGPIVVVSHMGPVKAGVIWAMQCGESCFPRIRIDNASLTRLHVSKRTRYLTSVNETQHLIPE